MQLALTVFVVVLGVTAIIGILGFLIDRNASRHEQSEGR
jgi:hypothetical protein